MAENLFITFFNMSISAVFVAAVLILWRGITKRFIPYRFFYLLWCTLFFRLLFPVSLRSPFSAFNLSSRMAEASVGGSYIVTMEYVDAASVGELIASRPDSGILHLAALIWLAVAVGLVLWGIFMQYSAEKLLRYATLTPDACAAHVGETLHLRRSVSVYISGRVESPIIMGLWRPRIILPEHFSLTEAEEECVLAHEMIHIRRADPIIKAVVYVICALHWYNPMVWLCFRLFNEDIETSCDQEVLRFFGASYKKAYASTLVDCAAKNQEPHRGYLAFAQSRVSDRVGVVLRYRRVGVLKTLLFALVTVVIGMSVSTNPVLKKQHDCTPRTVLVSRADRARLQSFIHTFTHALNAGDSEIVLNSSTLDTRYFSPLYEVFAADPLQVSEETIYYTSADSAVAYLQLTSENPLFSPDTNCLVLEISSRPLMGGLYAERLQSYDTYEAVHGVDETDEAVMLCRKMIKFGLTSGENTPENIQKITLFCMDIAREGQNAESLLPAQAVEQAAADFFEINDFTALRNTEYYDAPADAYHYDESTGTSFEYQIIDLEKTAEGAVVSAEFYKDPLQTQTEKIVKYTFQKAG